MNSSIRALTSCFRILFALVDRIQIDVVDHGLVVGNRAFGDVNPQFGLGPEDRKPELPFQTDPIRLVVDADHLLGGVSLGKDVGHGHRRTSAPLFVKHDLRAVDGTEYIDGCWKVVMNGHCDFHTFEMAVDVCDLCYGDLCRSCRATPEGP